MAKGKIKPKRKGGPYLAAAFFCERTIEDKQDGALSAIRMTDQINVMLDPSAPPDFPSETQRLPVVISGLLAFKTGDSPGEHVVRLVMHSPSGKKSTVLEQTLPFTPRPHGGANLRLNNVIAVKKGGLFWLHVFLDGRRVARMPLQITIQRASEASANQPGQPTSPRPSAKQENGEELGA